MNKPTLWAVWVIWKKLSIEAIWRLLAAAYVAQKRKAVIFSARFVVDTQGKASGL